MGQTRRRSYEKPILPLLDLSVIRYTIIPGMNQIWKSISGITEFSCLI